jgi:hypothetical protein
VKPMFIFTLAVALALPLVACGQHASSLPRPARLSREQVRVDAAVLSQLERDLAVLQRERDAALSNPAAFRATRTAVGEQLRTSDAAMVVASRVSPPPVRVAYPTQYRAALAQRNIRALALARQQYGEKESAVAYEYERAHGGKILQLRLRLQTLHLDEKHRAALRAQIAMFNAQEAATVAAQRSQDAAALARYRATLAAESAREYANMSSDVRAHPAIRPDTSVAPINVTQALQRANASAHDIDSRFADLQDRDAQATRRLDAEIASLRAECNRLRAELHT